MPDKVLFYNVLEINILQFAFPNSGKWGILGLGKFGYFFTQYFKHP